MDSTQQLLKNQLIHMYKISEFIRISMVYDLVCLAVLSPEIFCVEDVKKRNKEFVFFLEKDYELLLFLNEQLEKSEHLDNFESFLNLLDENQKLEAILNFNNAEYCSYFDCTLDFIWSNGQEKLLSILENQSNYISTYNKICENNKKIEKIKRMEM